MADMGAGEATALLAAIGGGSSILSGAMAPRPNAFYGANSPDVLMGGLQDKLGSEFNRQSAQADQGVQLPDAGFNPSPTYTGGVLPFPIGNNTPAMRGGTIPNMGAWGDQALSGGGGGSPATPGSPSPSPSTPAPGNHGASTPTGTYTPTPSLQAPPRDLTDNPVHKADVTRVSMPNSTPPGASNDDALAALRSMGMKLGF